MSNYKNSAVNPRTNKIEEAYFLDDYYGKHKFAVEFKDGGIYPLSEVKVSEDHSVKPNKKILKPSDRVFHFEKGKISGVTIPAGYASAIKDKKTDWFAYAKDNGLSIGYWIAVAILVFGYVSTLMIGLWFIAVSGS